MEKLHLSATCFQKQQLFDIFITGAVQVKYHWLWCDSSAASWNYKVYVLWSQRPLLVWRSTHMWSSEERRGGDCRGGAGGLACWAGGRQGAGALRSVAVAAMAAWGGGRELQPLVCEGGWGGHECQRSRHTPLQLPGCGRILQQHNLITQR